MIGLYIRSCVAYKHYQVTERRPTKRVSFCYLFIWENEREREHEADHTEKDHTHSYALDAGDDHGLIHDRMRSGRASYVDLSHWILTMWVETERSQKTKSRPRVKAPWSG